MVCKQNKCRARCFFLLNTSKPFLSMISKEFLTDPYYSLVFNSILCTKVLQRKHKDLVTKSKEILSTAILTRKASCARLVSIINYHNRCYRTHLEGF